MSGVVIGCEVSSDVLDGFVDGKLTRLGMEEGRSCSCMGLDGSSEGTLCKVGRGDDSGSMGGCAEGVLAKVGVIDGLS